MKNENQPCVYIMTNQYHTVLYTGVTSDLHRRVNEHRSPDNNAFSGKYRTTKLVYVELTDRMDDAIAREKQLKGGSRQQKLDLISKVNPGWNDLYDEYFGTEAIVYYSGPYP